MMSPRPPNPPLDGPAPPPGPADGTLAAQGPTLAGFAGYAGSTAIDLKLGLAISAAAVAGSVAGGSLSDRWGRTAVVGLVAGAGASVLALGLPLALSLACGVSSVFAPTPTPTAEPDPLAVYQEWPIVLRDTFFEPKNDWEIAEDTDDEYANGRLAIIGMQGGVKAEFNIGKLLGKSEAPPPPPPQYPPPPEPNCVGSAAEPYGAPPPTPELLPP